MVVVGDLPDPIARVDRDRLRLERRHGRDALVHRRRQNDGLERRPGLSLRLRGEVELALSEVPSAEHRLHLARARVDRNERGRRAVGVPEHVLDGRARLQLEAEVDRGCDLEPTAEHLARPVAGDELVRDVVHEVRRRALRSGESDVLRHGQFGLGRALVLALRDFPLLEHHREHVSTSQRRAPRIHCGVVERRIGRDPGEQSGLCEIELLRALLEVRARGLLDAVRAVAEVDGVQVRGEDPVLLPILLELPGKRCLSNLPRDAPFVADVRVLDELLRDRRAALDDALLADVLPEGARDPAQVDTVVLVEALILDRDDRLAHERRDVCRADEDAALVSAKDGEDTPAIGRVDDGVDVRVLSRRVECGYLARDCTNEAERERDPGRHEEDGQQRRKTTLANPAPRTRRPLLSPNPQEGKV